MSRGPVSAIVEFLCSSPQATAALSPSLGLSLSLPGELTSFYSACLQDGVGPLSIFPLTCYDLHGRPDGLPSCLLRENTQNSICLSPP